MAYYNRGLAYYMQGDSERALADLNEYVRLAGDGANPAVFELIEQIEAAQKQ